MSDKKIKQPKVRFKEFAGENAYAWEQRKLGDISDKVTEKNTNNNYDETLTNSAELGIITQRDFFDKDISNEKNLDGYYVVREDDFVYNPRISNFAPVGPIKRNKLGRTGVMSPLYYVFRTYDIDRTYLEYYFDSTCWHKFMQLNGDSGARADRFAIKSSVFVEMPIPFPELDEQKKIGQLLDTLTNLITLHQRELENTKDLKNTMLSKMFPKDGSDIPEFRFAGFTDPWEQRKLSDVADIIGGGTPSTDVPEYWGGKIDWYSPTEIGKNVYADSSEKKITELGYEKSSAKMLPADKTILFTSRAGIGDMAILRHPGTTNQGFQSLVLKEGYNTYFVYSAGYLIKKYALKHASGSTFLEISGKQLGKMEINVPVAEEQEKIGAFFKSIDDLVALHQRELETYQTLKQTMLDKMFI